jgi:AcrR family transcriptional regulator
LNTVHEKVNKMAVNTRTIERRLQLRLQLIEAAEATVSRDGLKALSARELSREVGCSLGAIYNVFEDIDALVVAVNSRTLAELDRTIAGFVPSVRDGTEPEECLVGLAQAYCRFAITHTNRWTALFEHGERINRNIPDWHLEEHVQLISHVVKSLERLYPDRKPAEQWQLAGLLFSAVHGVVSLGLQGFFFAVPPDQLEQQVTSLVQAALAGLPGSHPRQ